MAASIVCTYPLVFQAARSSVLAVVPAAGWTTVTVVLVGLTAVVGHCLDGLSFISALKGALALSTVAFTMPGLLHLRVFPASLEWCRPPPTVWPAEAHQEQELTLRRGGASCRGSWLVGEA